MGLLQKLLMQQRGELEKVVNIWESWGWSEVTRMEYKTGLVALLFWFSWPEVEGTQKEPDTFLMGQERDQSIEGKHQQSQNRSQSRLRCETSCYELNWPSLCD